MDSHPSQTNQLADVRERTARLEVREENHHHLLSNHQRLLQEIGSRSLETAAAVRSLRHDFNQLRRAMEKPALGLSETTIKLALAVLIPLAVLLLTKDPKTAAATARSLLSGGVGH